jgi:cytochrome c-type biogenesis protein CcmE
VKFGKMKTHRRNRLLLVLFLVVGAGGAATFTLLALNENINLFYSPEQIVEGEAPSGQTIRAGGMVVEGSVVRSETDLGVSFLISDLKSAEVTVRYEGILPDLFREGQGVIARGQLNQDGEFVADEVLAKHDENYMPPEVADVIAEAHEEGKARGG